MIRARLLYSRYHVAAFMFGSFYIIHGFFTPSTITTTTSNSSSNRYLQHPFTSSTASLAVDIPSILSAIPSGQESAAWTDNDGSNQPFTVLGSSPARYVEFDDSSIIDFTTGENMRGGDGTTFNLAVLKLPVGSGWGFLGVARGPTRRRYFMTVNEHPGSEQVLVAFGLNLTTKGILEVVSDVQTLDFPMSPKQGCVPTQGWAATYGAEDPRLFWTDSGTPGFTFARFSDSEDHCRGIGYIRDFRSVFPPLVDVLKTGDGIARYEHAVRPGEAKSLELFKLSGQNIVEKNWAAFFPGYEPNPMTTEPSIYYDLDSAQALEPSSANLRRISYVDVPAPPFDIADCPKLFHPEWRNKDLHQATPLHRLTLCERGCKADAGNTVFFSLANMKEVKRYAKFFMTFNVTSPYAPISVGPIFTINGLEDGVDLAFKFNYILSLVPLEPHDLDPKVPPIRTPKNYHPGHFFIDDNMLITLGHDDSSMMSAIVPVREAIGRQRICGADSSDGLG